MALKNLLSEKRLKPVNISTADPKEFESGAIIVGSDGVLSTSNGTNAFTMKNHPDLFKPLTGLNAGDIPKGYAYIDSATGKIMQANPSTGAIEEHNTAWGALPTIKTNEAGVTANGNAIAGHAVRLTAAEGTITTHGTDIGTLQSDVTTIQGDVTAVENLANSTSTKVTNIITASGLTTTGLYRISDEGPVASNAGIIAIGDATLLDGKNNFLATDVGLTVTFLVGPGYLQGNSYTITAFTSTGSVELDAAYQSVVVDNAGGIEFSIDRPYTYYEIHSATNAREADRGLSINLQTTKLNIGLDIDGNYVAPIGTSYLGSSMTVMGALGLLDTQVSGNATDIGLNASKSANIASSIGGLSANGTWQNFTGTNYINTATSIKNGMTKLDTQVQNNANGIALNTLEIGVVQATASNLTLAFGNMTGPDGSWGTGLVNDITGSNYMAGSTDLTNALMKLDAQIALNDDSRFHGIVKDSYDTTGDMAVFDKSNDRKNGGLNPVSLDEILYIYAASTIQMQHIGFAPANIQPTAEIYNNTVTDYTLGYSVLGSTVSNKGYLDVEAWTNSPRVGTGTWEDVHVPDAITVGAGQKLTIFTVDKPFGVLSANKVDGTGTPIASNKTIYGYFRIESI